MKIIIEEQEVDEMISLQELYDAYENLAYILNSDSKVKDEFHFTVSQREVMQKEYDAAYNKIVEWWNKICEKYKLDNNFVEKFYLDYSTRTIKVTY